MAKALLISYPGVPINPTTFIPDNGLASLAGALISRGHDAYILDYGTVEMLRRSFPNDAVEQLSEIFNSRMSSTLSDNQITFLGQLDQEISDFRHEELIKIGREVVETISRIGADFVGFKTWAGDGHEGLLKIARAIKEHFRDMPIIVGGSLIQPFAEIFLKKNIGIDFACYDEGEETVSAFAEYVDGKSSIDSVPNLLYLKGDHIVRTEHVVTQDLDTLPFPIYDRDIYPATGDDQKFNMIVIDESRRCHFKCPFCIESAKVPSRWRSKSAHRVLEEIERVKKAFGTRLIRFGGQMTPGNLLESISESIIQKGVGVEFTAFSHISAFKNVDLELLTKAGLYALFFGVESGNQRMLSTTLGKKTKVEDIEDVLKRSSSAGIYTVASIIYPAPGDTDETMADTVNLLDRCCVQSAPVQFAGVYPNSTWYREYKKFGFDLDPVSYPKTVISYKIKTLFPPQFWDPLPVKIDNKEFLQYAAETGEIVRMLEERGILTDVTDETALLAKHAGLTDRELRDQSAKAFYCGDWKQMRRLVKEVNRDKASI